MPPNQLKGALRRVGIDLDKIAGSLGDAAVFATGGSTATASAAPWC